MKSIFIEDYSNLNNEKSNFNLFPSVTPSNDSKSSNFISGLNISAAPNLSINNNINNIKESQKKIHSNNIIESVINEKRYTNDIKNEEDNFEINSNNKNDQSIFDNGQLFIDIINNGFIPFFIKIEDYNPLYFIANKETIFKNILKRYITDKGKKNINSYIFYNNDEIIDKNMSLENLNIKPLSIIIGKREEI